MPYTCLNRGPDLYSLGIFDLTWCIQIHGDLGTMHGSLFALLFSSAAVPFGWKSFMMCWVDMKLQRCFNSIISQIAALVNYFYFGLIPSDTLPLTPCIYSVWAMCWQFFNFLCWPSVDSFLCWCFYALIYFIFYFYFKWIISWMGKGSHRRQGL